MSHATAPAGKRLSLPVFQPDFMKNAKLTSVDEDLHAALENSVVKKDDGRREALRDLPDADGLRTVAGLIKRHTLDHLPEYLLELEANIQKAGGVVHWAATGEEANRIVVEIAQANAVKLAVKSKSMVSEETELNTDLEAAGIEVIETDLGEFVIQVDHDHPSHIVMPIIHKRAKQVGESFAKYFKTEFTEDPQALAEMARVYLRNKFDQAEMGITGVNFAVAETGTVVMCTNEGNGRMCASRPRIHVALMGIEKLIPKLADLPVFLKLLARSATGQALTQYTNLVTGPRRAGELDGPEQFHLVLIDNGRSKVLGSEYRDVLRCIRCGACLNACPIYRTVGGHSYGSVYPGPIGALITPLFNGLELHKHLPQASSLCGACYEACPVKIPIPDMLIKLKIDMQKQGITPWYEKVAFRLWSWSLSSTAGYVLGQKMQQWMLRARADKQGWITKLPGPGKGWTDAKDFPAPAPSSFRAQWRALHKK